jgi:hypothetical protein
MNKNHFENADTNGYIKKTVSKKQSTNFMLLQHKSKVQLFLQKKKLKETIYRKKFVCTIKSEEASNKQKKSRSLNHHYKR